VVVAAADYHVARSGPGAAGQRHLSGAVNDAQVHQVLAYPAAQLGAPLVVGGNQQHVWAPGGLSDDELQALTRLAGRTIGAPAGVPGARELHVRVTGQGSAELLPPGFTGPATSWVSATPYVPTRHRGRNQNPADFIQAEIERELRYRHITKPVSVTQISRPEWALHTRHRFTPHRRPGQTVKSTGSRNENQPVYAIRIDFSQPVQGPLTLGTLSHFGLGLFETEQI
jgi:CRISPR-associated protein Csb2